MVITINNSLCNRKEQISRTTSWYAWLLWIRPHLVWCSLSLRSPSYIVPAWPQ